MLDIKLKGNAKLYTKLLLKFFFLKKGLPGCAHFIRMLMLIYNDLIRTRFWQ